MQNRAQTNHGKRPTPEAEDLAAKSDVAVVIVGTNDDWETEGRDRDSFSSPATKSNSLSESV